MALASMEWSRALHGFEPYKKRLRYDIAKRWTHGMFSSLRHITCVPNRGGEAAYVHQKLSRAWMSGAGRLLAKRIVGTTDDRHGAREGPRVGCTQWTFT